MSDAAVRYGAEPAVHQQDSTPRPWTWVEIVLLLLAPALAFLLMRFKPIAQDGGLDPFVYTGYINNFADLFERYGITYYGVRFGLILPGKLLVSLFGSVGGYFALRYCLVLLAGLPFYALIRKHYGRGVAAAMFTGLLASPFLARTMLWDYPDASGVSYLLAALSLVLLEPRRRYLGALAAGCLAGLAVHSNFFVIAPLGAFLGTYALVWLLARRGWRALASRAACVLAGMLAVTAVGVAFYWWSIGTWDIFSVTIKTALWLAAGGTKNWRSADPSWLISRWAALTPVFLTLLALLAAGLRNPAFHEKAVLYGGLSTVAFFYSNQFLMVGNSLELYYYFSYSLPAIFLLLAVIVGRLAREDAWGVVPVLFVAASLLPWVLYALGVTAFSGWSFGEHLVLVGVTGLLVFAATRWRRPLPWFPVSAALLLGVMFWSSFFQPRYAAMVNSWERPEQRERAVYNVALQFMEAVRTSTGGRGSIRFWYSNEPRGNSMQSVQSMFLWGYSRVQGDGAGLPSLEPQELALITAPEVSWLALMAERPQQLQEAREVLGARGVAFQPVALRVFASGDYRVYFQLLRLQKSPKP